MNFDKKIKPLLALKSFSRWLGVKLPHPRSRELELEVMRLRNEINKIGVNVNQIVKNNNSHMYSEDDKMNLISNMEKISILLKNFI